MVLCPLIHQYLSQLDEELVVPANLLFDQMEAIDGRTEGSTY